MAEERKGWPIIKRIVAAVLGVCILGFVLFVANIFVGNPISKAIATNKVEKYLEGVYPGSTIDDVYYTIDGCAYGFVCTIENEEQSIFYSKNSLIDYNVNTYYSDKFDEDFQQVKASVETDDIGIDASVFTSVITNGKYSTDYDQLTVRQMLYLSISNKDNTLSKDESTEMPAKMFMRVLNALGEGYEKQVRSTQTIYMDRYGGYEIIIKNKSLSFEELLHDTKRIENIGEEGRSFVDSLNETVT